MRTRVAMRRRLSIVLMGVGATLCLTAGIALATHDIHRGGVGPLHWQSGYVYWADDTGPEWPVLSQAIAWDGASNVDGIYSSSSASCTSGHCVTVREAPLGGCDGTLGDTHFDYYSSGHFIPNSVYIRIDQDCSGLSSTRRRELACHEMGHSLGLDHRPASSSSCMTIASMNSRVQNAHDYAQLAAMYNHSD